MYNFKGFLQDLSESTKIHFELFGEDGTEIFAEGLGCEKKEYIYLPICLEKSKAILHIPKSHEVCASLLKYTIENKYKELFSMREQSLIDILEGKEVFVDTINKNLPFLLNGCMLFLVKVDGSRYEALNIIKQLYDKQDVLSILYGNNIVVIGEFEEISDHAKSIRDSIVSDLYCKCFVSYANMVYDAENIKKAYEDAKACIMLAKQFDIKDEVLSYNDMIFEKIVSHINDEVKEELLQNFREKFNVFDNEMITTIEEFVNAGLNISDAAKKLYIHRNTLIYRLDKICKETGFDIRNFREAIVFVIAFLVWKEKR